MSYLDNENESLKREVASLEGDLRQVRGLLVGLGAVINTTLEGVKKATAGYGSTELPFTLQVPYRALEYIERQAYDAVRKSGASGLTAEHYKGEATSTEDLAKWLGWNKETPTSIKLDADGAYPVEKVVELLESINSKLGHIDIRTSMK